MRVSRRWVLPVFLVLLKVQGHLANVFAALMATVLACTVGVVLDLRLHLGGFLTILGGVAALMWMVMDKDKTNYTKRVYILLLFGLLQGFSLGNLVAVVLDTDPGILITALLATTTIFGCFAGSALVAKRRSLLYLGGLISSTMMVLMLASIINLFLRLPFLFDIQLYVGLFMFCGYVMFDSQIIVEKACQGDRDYPMHAAELFLDFVGIFVRICIILLRKDKKTEKNSRSSVYR
ncbi:unnamed protein product [Choristocarpus tenellus]